jgi:hypothetical protein
MVSGGPVPGSHGGGPHADVSDGGGVQLSREDVDDPVGGGDGQLPQHGQAHQQPCHVLQGGCGVAKIIARRPALYGYRPGIDSLQGNHHLDPFSERQL